MMRKLKRWVLPAILIGGMVSILTACKNNKSVNEMSIDEIKEKVGASLLLLKGNLILAKYIDKLNKSHNP